MTTVATTRRRGLRLTGLVAVGMLALSGCQGQVSNGYLPNAVSDSGVRVTNLWVGSWIAVLAVGAITWGLMLYAAIRFRKRRGDETLPVQLRYNVPVELLYTIIPVFMVAVFFYYTARDEAALTDTSKKPDVTISVVAKQWSWDFNYVDSNVHETGAHTELNGQEGARAKMPVLYLPVNKRVEFVLNSRDVIHSFWVPAFMTKLDIIPGKTNKLQIVPTETGTFQGKCAELCGAYHSQMLFMVKIVSQEEYDQQMSRLAELGQTGLIPVDASREKMEPADANKIPAPARTGSNN
ncbi:cytochrome C oxidase subunit II [Intrasporangium oryzae NRRL B-24470]|uniref:cytochrome-c oxidase n=1 Tax=Intrasporangium oryzae NRRL B-24470 TaxID=1386089 RepID=W9G9P1_9MICO|nr:cytochrome C oxidase subunit II [Intrasporangium oryzae NRRL B-24470]